MKIIIRTLTLASLFFIAFSTVQAQRGNWNADPEQRAEQETATMKEQLSLSEKQAAKVKTINLKYANKMKEAREANSDQDWAAIRETMGNIRQEQAEELKTVLTKEQSEKWAAYQEEQRSQRKQKGGKEGKGQKSAPKDKKS